MMVDWAFHGNKIPFFTGSDVVSCFTHGGNEIAHMRKIQQKKRKLGNNSRKPHADSKNAWNVFCSSGISEGF
jgi:hypothetical protein